MYRLEIGSASKWMFQPGAKFCAYRTALRSATYARTHGASETRSLISNFDFENFQEIKYIDKVYKGM